MQKVFVQIAKMYLSKLLNIFVQIDQCICLNYKKNVTLQVCQVDIKKAEFSFAGISGKVFISEYFHLSSCILLALNTEPPTLERYSLDKY